MQIALRRGDISVTKNIFYDVNVDAARVQPRPQGVMQIMEAEIRPANNPPRRPKFLKATFTHANARRRNANHSAYLSIV